MNFALLVLLCILVIEVVFRFNLIKNLLLIYKNLYVVFSTILNKKISDHWKEKAIPIYAFNIIIASIKIFLIIMFIVILFLVAIRYKAGFLELSISLPGALTALFFSIIYFGFRKKYED